jgi:transcriptional regulator with XRE-family HTH domain
MTFGSVLSNARKAANLSQRELAALLKKDDGEPISPQYLNDLERDRRNPPSDSLIQQLAKILKVETDYLYACAEKFPPDLKGARVNKKAVVAVFKSLRKSVGRRQ